MEHSFDVEIATKYGIAEAILLKHIWFWCTRNRERQKNFHNDTYWMYYPLREFQKNFCYLKPSKIRSALEKLEKEGLIITGNFNQKAMDRTKWYAVTERAIDMCENSQLEWTENNTETHEENNVSSICENSQMHLPKSENGEKEADTDNQPKEEKKSTKKEKPVKHKYGEYNNVLLTDEEFQKLSQICNVYEMIERLSGYIASKGVKYKSHYATIRNWINRERKSGQKTPVRNSGADELNSFYEMTANWAARRGNGDPFEH